MFKCHCGTKEVAIAIAGAHLSPCEQKRKKKKKKAVSDWISYSWNENMIILKIAFWKKETYLSWLREKKETKW